jgi:hypothetical protein
MVGDFDGRCPICGRTDICNHVTPNSVTMGHGGSYVKHEINNDFRIEDGEPAAAWFFGAVVAEEETVGPWDPNEFDIRFLQSVGMDCV